MPDELTGAEVVSGRWAGKMSEIQARSVRVGDVISWCGRWCEVLDIKPVVPRNTRKPGRPGRRFSLRLPDGVQKDGLHYYDTEWVMAR